MAAIAGQLRKPTFAGGINRKASLPRGRKDFIHLAHPRLQPQFVKLAPMGTQRFKYRIPAVEIFDLVVWGHDYPGNRPLVTRLRLGEDHSSGRGLKHFGHHDAKRVIQILFAIFDDNHGAIIEVGHTLANFPPFLNDLD